MARDKSTPTEKTPKGFEVRVPKRGEFFSNLKRAVKPDNKPSATRRPKK
jgi:hypothetical protein